jgi:outer membrane receptor for ferrienterochelin and colicin
MQGTIKEYYFFVERNLVYYYNITIKGLGVLNMAIHISDNGIPYDCRNNLLITFFGILFLIFVPLYGQESKMNDDAVNVFDLTLEELLELEVEVSSTKGEKVFHASSTVTVVDGEMIVRYNFLSIAEALESVAGIEVYQTIIDRNVTTSRGILQNFYANKILLLIDNVPTWQPIYGDGHLERIAIHDVERIEVLKGPASVLYGSNAYSGVINIVLKKDRDTGVRAFGRLGYRHLGSSGVAVNYNKSDLKLFFSANMAAEERKPYMMQSAQGFEYNGTLDFLYEEQENQRNVNVDISYKGHSFYLNNFTYRHTFMGAHPSYVGGAGNFVNNWGTLINYRYQKDFNKKVHLRSDLTYDDFQRDFPLSADRVTVISIAGDRLVGQLKLNLELSKKWGIELGGAIENRHSRGHDTINGLDGSLMRHNLDEDDDILEWSTFAQLSYRGPLINVLMGTRYTRNVLFGDNVSSRITGVLKISKNRSIKLICGQSFRVPTMFELYFNHPTVVGNTGLKPELSTSYELAYLVGGKRLYLQVLGYYGIYKNLIQRVTPVSGPPSEYKNVDLFKGFGAEIEIKYHCRKKLNAFVNYNFIRGAQESGNQYRFVPDHTINFGIHKPLGKFSLACNGKWVSHVHGHLEDIASQFRLDAHLGFSHYLNDIRVRHVLSGKNLTSSQMLIPEYIRQTPNINTIPVTGFGRRIVYSIFVEF